MADTERQLTERARTTAVAALEVVPFAMLIADGSGHALAVNSRWMELSGLTRADSIGPGWLSVLDPEARSRLREVVVGVASQGGPATVDLQIATGPQPRWVRWWASRHELEGVPLLAVAAADVDADYTRQADLYYLATHDSLTGLVNRSHFLDSIEQALRRARRQQRRIAVVYVDLDDFKRVNDGGGHSLGDRVLYAIAARLRHAVRSADMVARIGGDEFAVLCEGLSAGEQADAVAQRIAAALAESVELDGHRWTVAASVGAAMDRGDLEAPEHLVDRADQAMYTVKLARRPPESLGEEPPAASSWVAAESTPTPSASPWGPAAGPAGRPAAGPPGRPLAEPLGREPAGAPSPPAAAASPAAVVTEPAAGAYPPAAEPEAYPPAAEPEAYPPAAEPEAYPPAAEAYPPAPEPMPGVEPAPVISAGYRGPERRSATRRRDDPAPDPSGGPADILDPDEARRALHELAQAASDATAALSRPGRPAGVFSPAPPRRSTLPEAGSRPPEPPHSVPRAGSGGGGPTAPVGTTGAGSSPAAGATGLTTAAPPPPHAEPGEADASRERLASDVMRLRESIDSIRRTLDRLLSGGSDEPGVIDIRDRP